MYKIHLINFIHLCAVTISFFWLAIDNTKIRHYKRIGFITAAVKIKFRLFNFSVVVLSVP